VTLLDLKYVQLKTEIAFVMRNFSINQASYRDPKTGLQYCTADVYQFIQSLPHAVVQEYLKLRKAEHKI